MDAQTLAELNNLRIRIDERDGKIVRQSSVITKLEQSRIDLRKANDALLRVARAAKHIARSINIYLKDAETGTLDLHDWTKMIQYSEYPTLCNALEAVEHLL